MLSTRLVMTSRSTVGISLGAAKTLRKRPVPPSKTVPPAIAPSFRNSRRYMIGPLQSPALDVEPWRYPDIFNVKHQAQEHLDGQADHGQEKNHQDGILQEALALIIFWVVAAIQRVHDEAADGEKAADYHSAEDGFA